MAKTGICVWVRGYYHSMCSPQCNGLYRQPNRNLSRQRHEHLLPNETETSTASTAPGTEQGTTRDALTRRRAGRQTGSSEDSAPSKQPDNPHQQPRRKAPTHADTDRSNSAGEPGTGSSKGDVEVHLKQPSTQPTTTS